MVKPNDRRIKIFSRKPIPNQKLERSDCSIDNVEEKFKRFELSAQIDIPLSIELWAFNDTQDIDRFLQCGDWVFQISHGFDYLGFLAEDVQVRNEPKMYEIEGVIKEKKQLEIIGPTKPFLDRINAIKKI